MPINAKLKTQISRPLPEIARQIGLPSSIVGFGLIVIWLMLFNYINVFLGMMVSDAAPAWVHFLFFLGFLVAVGIILWLVAGLFLLKPPQGQIEPITRLDSARETLRRRRFRYKIIAEEDELEKVTTLTRRIFGDHHPDNRRIEEIFRRNNCKSVVLIEYKSDPNSAESGEPREIYLAKSGGIGAIRGYASIWPLTDEAGERMVQGLLNEEQIEVADVLPRSHNSEANYLYVTGIADLGSRAWHNSTSGLAQSSAVSSTIIAIALLELITAEFIKDTRLRQVSMIEETKEGGNLIAYFSRRLPESRKKFAQIMQGGKPSTVTTISVNAEDVRRAREQLLRRLAGVQESLYEYTETEGFWY